MRSINFISIVAGILLLPLSRLIPGLLYVGLLLILFGSIRGILTSRWGKGLGFLFKSLKSEEIPSQEKKENPQLEIQILTLAKSSQGQLTISQVAIHCNISWNVATEMLNEFVRKGAATLAVDMHTGIATYSFTEFLPRTPY